MKFLIFNFVCILTVVMLALDSAALSVVSDFLENNTLVIKEGESKLYGIRLQNPTDEEAHFKLTYDNQIAKIVDYQEVYAVSPQTNKPLYFNITTRSLKPGSYVMSYTVHELSGSGQGVPILLKINKDIKIKVDKNPEKSLNSNYLVYTAIIALFLLSYIFRKRLKRVYLLKTQIKNRKVIKY